MIAMVLLSIPVVSFLPMLVETTDSLNLAPDPSFEDTAQGVNGWSPLGIVVEGREPLTVADGISRDGDRSMKVEVGPSGATDGLVYYSSYNAGEGKREVSGHDGVRGARTIAYRLDRDIRSFKASLWVKSESDIQIKVKWYSRNGRKRPVELAHTDAVFQVADSKDGWTKYEIEAMRPHLTHQAELWVETTGDSPFYVDDVHIALPRLENLQILADQVGYEPESQTKEILLQSSIPLENLASTFTVVDLNSLESIFEGNWVALGYHESFDRYYWRGDLSSLKRPGTYAAETRYGKEKLSSVSFDIQENLADKVARLAYEFFYYQRCGMEVPGFHKACHLDDARMPDGSHRDLAGGWHDAGDYNKYNVGFTPESLYALALTYSRKREFFRQFDRDNDGVCDILDEAIWGAEYMRKCLDMDTGQVIANVSTGYGYWGAPGDETDNVPNSDDRPVTNGYTTPGFIVGGFALVGKYSDPNYVTLAEELYRRNGGSIRDLVALCQATEKEKYYNDLKKKIQELISGDDGGLSQFQALAEYAIAFPDAEEIPAIKELAQAGYNEILSAYDEYFRVRRGRDAAGKPCYFRQYNRINDWYVGESMQILDLAYAALLLEQLGQDEARQIAENQLHWILGRNPFNTSLMEEAGKRFVPRYHHRYNMIPGNQRGAVPGAILNGITRAWPWTDRPWLDMNPTPNGEYQPNEPWLPHNIRMLYVMSIW